MVNLNNLDSMIQSKNDKDVLDALLSISMNNIDYLKAIDFVKMHINNENQNIKRIAILSLGHIARVYKKMDTKTFVPFLISQSKSDNKKIAATADEVLDDFKIFLKVS
jgi:hypothetical protein